MVKIVKNAPFHVFTLEFSNCPTALNLKVCNLMMFIKEIITCTLYSNHVCHNQTAAERELLHVILIIVVVVADEAKSLLISSFPDDGGFFWFGPASSIWRAHPGGRAGARWSGAGTWGGNGNACNTYNVDLGKSDQQNSAPWAPDFMDSSMCSLLFS